LEKVVAEHELQHFALLFQDTGRAFALRWLHLFAVKHLELGQTMDSVQSVEGPNRDGVPFEIENLQAGKPVDGLDFCEALKAVARQREHAQLPKLEEASQRANAIVAEKQYLHIQKTIRKLVHVCHILFDDADLVCLHRRRHLPQDLRQPQSLPLARATLAPNRHLCGFSFFGLLHLSVARRARGRDD